jgi:hypothetical protein
MYSQPPPMRGSHCCSPSCRLYCCTIFTLLPEATNTGNPGVEKSSLKVSTLICGLLILEDVLAAAAHAQFTLLFALVQALLLYYLYLYTPPGGRQTQAIRELKSLP